MRAMLTRAEGSTRGRALDSPHESRRTSLPVLLTVDEAAGLLRTTRRAIYANPAHVPETDDAGAGRHGQAGNTFAVCSLRRCCERLLETAGYADIAVVELANHRTWSDDMQPTGSVGFLWPKPQRFRT